MYAALFGFCAETMSIYYQYNLNKPNPSSCIMRKRVS